VLAAAKEKYDAVGTQGMVLDASIAAKLVPIPVIASSTE
jgi:hypothetical protein